MPTRRRASDPGEATQVVDDPTALLPPAADPPPPDAPVEDPPPERELWPWLVVLLVLVIAALIGAWLAARQNGGSPHAAPAPVQTVAAAPRKAVTVPDVTGRRVAAALGTLRVQGLGANVVRVPSDRAAGQVVAQHPKGGASAPFGSTVRLNVATPASPASTTSALPASPPDVASVTVPDVRGQEVHDAREQLRGVGLVLEMTKVPNRLPKNTVVSQSPGGNTAAMQGDHVLVTVSRGPAKDGKRHGGRGQDHADRATDEQGRG
jgi:beta-lactam-binding protein with PASTA domain